METNLEGMVLSYRVMRFEFVQMKLIFYGQGPIYMGLSASGEMMLMF